MTTKEKQREAKPMSPEARPAHRHCDYATRVQAHLAKHAGALALIQKTIAEITDPTRTYQSGEVYALINKRIERDRTFFDALHRLGFAGQSGFGSLTARACWSCVRCRRKARVWRQADQARARRRYQAADG